MWECDRCAAMNADEVLNCVTCGEAGPDGTNVEAWSDPTLPMSANYAGPVRQRNTPQRVKDQLSWLMMMTALFLIPILFFLPEYIQETVDVAAYRTAAISPINLPNSQYARVVVDAQFLQILSGGRHPSYQPYVRLTLPNQTTNLVKLAQEHWPSRSPQACINDLHTKGIAQIWKGKPILVTADGTNYQTIYNPEYALACWRVPTVICILAAAFFGISAMRKLGQYRDLTSNR
jgi:hypothetical protein